MVMEAIQGGGAGGEEGEGEREGEEERRHLTVTPDELVRRLRSGEMQHVKTVAVTTDDQRRALPAWVLDVLAACSESPDICALELIRVRMTAEVLACLPALPGLHLDDVSFTHDDRCAFEAYLSGRTDLSSFTTSQPFATSPVCPLASAALICLLLNNPGLDTLIVQVSDAAGAVDVVRHVPRGIRKCAVGMPTAPPAIVQMATDSPASRARPIPTLHNVYSDAMVDAIVALLDESTALEELEIWPFTRTMISLTLGSAPRIIEALERNTRITHLNLRAGPHKEMLEILERNRTYAQNDFVLK